MNRIEFMRRLEELLQDLSLEEINEAIQYYNDYFDDAGEDQEERIIKELGSPEKLAMEVKAGLKAEHSDKVEYRETGYTDTRFEEKKAVVNYTAEEKRGNAYEYTYADISSEEKSKNERRTKKTVKYVLLGLLILLGLPIAIPLAIGLLGMVLGLAIVLLALIFVGFVLLGVMVVVGVALVAAGFAALISRTLAGIALIGIGLMVGVAGVAATVGVGYVCIRFLPKLFRKIGELCEKIFKRKGKVQ